MEWNSVPSKIKFCKWWRVSTKSAVLKGATREVRCSPNYSTVSDLYFLTSTFEYLSPDRTWSRTTSACPDRNLNISGFHRVRAIAFPATNVTTKRCDIISFTSGEKILNSTQTLYAFVIIREKCYRVIFPILVSFFTVTRVQSYVGFVGGVRNVPTQRPSLRPNIFVPSQRKILFPLFLCVLHALSHDDDTVALPEIAIDT